MYQQLLHHILLFALLSVLEYFGCVQYRQLSQQQFLIFLQLPGCLVYRFIKTHTYLIIKNDKCQNPNFKSNLNYQMSKILIGVRGFEI